MPRWVHEGIASYMVGAWPDDHERLMRELVASGDVPAVSQLTGSGGFASVGLNEALGHVAFDYIESRWGPTSIRRFLNGLIVPRVGRTYDAVFDLTPAVSTMRRHGSNSRKRGSPTLTFVRGWFARDELRQAAPAFGLAHMLDSFAAHQPHQHSS